MFNSRILQVGLASLLTAGQGQAFAETSPAAWNREALALLVVPGENHGFYDVYALWRVSLWDHLDIALDLSTRVELTATLGGFGDTEQITQTPLAAFDIHAVLRSSSASCDGNSLMVDGQQHPMLCDVECDQCNSPALVFKFENVPIPSYANSLTVKFNAARGALPEWYSIDDAVTQPFNGSAIFWDRWIESIDFEPVKFDPDMVQLSITIGQAVNYAGDLDLSYYLIVKGFRGDVISIQHIENHWWEALAEQDQEPLPDANCKGACGPDGAGGLHAMYGMDFIDSCGCFTFHEAFVAVIQSYHADHLHIELVSVLETERGVFDSGGLPDVGPFAFSDSLIVIPGPSPMPVRPDQRLDADQFLDALIQITLGSTSTSRDTQGEFTENSTDDSASSRNESLGDSAKLDRNDRTSTNTGSPDDDRTDRSRPLHRDRSDDNPLGTTDSSREPDLRQSRRMRVADKQDDPSLGDSADDASRSRPQRRIADDDPLGTTDSSREPDLRPIRRTKDETKRGASSPDASDGSARSRD
jgi:hypothetical protein